MENPTPGMTGTTGPKPEDTPPEVYEHEMARTRDAITEKVAALESQVVGTVQAVTGTVEAVKDAITAAPSAVSDTVKQTVEAVKDTVKGTVESVKETVRQFSVSECVRNNPWAAVGTSAAGGFLIGYLLGGTSRRRPIMARSHDEPAPRGRPGTADEAPPVHYAAAAPEPAHSEPGLLGSLFGTVGKQIREVAEQAMSTAMAALKRSVGTAVPEMVDSAVHQVTERVTGPAADDTTRVHGPSYSARA